MKKFYNTFCLLFLLFTTNISAQEYQLPNNQFEDWSGAAFDGVAQPANWNYSNVTQFGYKFNFAHKETGRTGSCLLIQDQDLKVAGIGETSPGYVSLGQPWVYIESLTKVSEATAGTYGGVSWTHRPDTLAVWIKRTGGNAMKEDWHVLYYSWTGTAKSDKYKGKNGQCTSVSKEDEESDIRLSTDGNECGTTQAAHQVAEGWIRDRAIYNEWTQIKIPIYYIDNTVPEKMNVIFSASNYPNFRANSGLYAGNSLYVDDVELIYSSKIQQLYIDGTEWKAFDPNSEEIQFYTLNENATTTPPIKAYRGAGQLTNTKGITTNFLGRQLQGSEIVITNGEIDKTPTTITVKAEDGKSVTNYRIQFVHKSSNNAYLNGIKYDDKNIKNFNPYITDYTIEVPFGTTKVPNITCIPQDDQQSISITQATSLSGTATIVVTAADKQTKQTYTIHFKEAILKDNTLQGIKVNGKLIEKFSPTKTNYIVEIPASTTEMPTVEAISAYAAGQQTIQMTAPSQIDNGVYQIAVSSPGNQTPLIYRLTFKITVSTNCSLQGIFLDGILLDNFSNNITSYRVTLPVGTTVLPTITYTKGDSEQTVKVTEGGINGTTYIDVTAASGATRSYIIEFTTTKSDVCTLNGILLDGELINGFEPNRTSYIVQLPIGTTALPTITVTKADESETVSIKVDEVKNTCRIIVSADNGATTVYQITFQIAQSTDASLKNILIDSVALQNFHPDTLEYYYTLPSGSNQLPTIEYITNDKYQTITTRSEGVNGDYKIIVRPQSGNSQTYIIHFSVQKATNTALINLLVDNKPLSNFHPDTLNYTDTLESAHVPEISYQSAIGQKVIVYQTGNTFSVKVTAESGATRIYTYSYIVRKSENAFLDMIYLNGDSLADFQKEILSYQNLYLNSDTCPAITVSHAIDQQVSILSPAGSGIARIIVTAGAGNSNTYYLHFIDTTAVHAQPLAPDPEYILSSDVTLSDIQMDGVSISNFVATQHYYAIHLSAGSQMPTIAFIPNSDKQSITAGRTQVGEHKALVTAENGDTATYLVKIDIALYDNALLQDIRVDGFDLSFSPEVLSYQLTLEEGQALPNVSYIAHEGQTIMMYTPNADQQAIIVTAQSGRQNTYYITYTRELSQTVLLRDIIVGDSSIFVPGKFDYTYPLQRNSQFVPMVNAIGTNNQQTITTYFSAVNGTTLIHVVAADGVTSSDYTIYFPKELSNNVSLSDLLIISSEETYTLNQINFMAEQTAYTITLPYNAQLSPTIKYEKSEPEQQISFTARPIGLANEITVRAENGDKRTYSITFEREELPKNILRHIRTLMHKDTITWIDSIVFADASQREFTINLPYGTNDFSITEIGKNYDEQSVIVQPGGIYNPTIITVYANNEDKQPTIYTISPKVLANSAMLTDINVNGITIEGFTPNRFSYIVNVTEKPIIRYTLPQGATINILEQTSKHWKAEVNCDGYINLYDVWFYYTTDIIPNGEFTEWTTAKYNNAEKPAGWHMLADYFDKCDSWKVVCLGSNYSDEHLERSDNDKVHLITSYKCNMARAVPSFITLGTISGEYNTSSNFQVSGGITFRNTPDLLSINYKQDDIANYNIIRYELTGSNGIYSRDWNDDKESNFTTHNFDLSDANNGAGYPNSMNITINSYYRFTGDLGNGKTDASMYLDYIRFSYNNTLSKIFVNGKAAEKDNNSFSYILSSSTDNALPQLSFVGEVSDQAQKVVWDEPVVEGEYSIRRATITNYGEDGNYSTYTLDVKRPMDATNVLAKLLVGGQSIENWSPERTSYTYTLPYGTTNWPDVKPELSNNMQHCTTMYNDSVVTITIQPEKGETKKYMILFQVENVNDMTHPLDIQTKDINLIHFDPQQKEYTIATDTLPEIYIFKRYDAQQITCENGIILVSINGMQLQYKINLQKSVVPTTGQLTEIAADGFRLADFATDTYLYTQNLPDKMSFTRVNASDSVIFVRKPNIMQWHVLGTQEHTYQLIAPTTLSNKTELKGIYLGANLIDGFVAQEKEYTIYADSSAYLTIVGNKNQKISIQTTEDEYLITVTAEDGTIDATPYHVNISPLISSDNNLAAIYMNGEPLYGFRSGSTFYTYMVAVGEYKDHELTIPNISYQTSNDKATVEIEQGRIGEVTNLRVTAQNGSYKDYQILILGQKSSNASLSIVAINNIPLQDFDPDRTYYSTQVPASDITLDYRSKDRYQTITESINENLHILHVVAEDGEHEKDYIIQVYVQSPSNDATLAHIYLDGDKLENYYPDLNDGLYYHPNMNRYQITLPKESSLPNISAISKVAGQNIEVRKEENNILIDVIAPDSITTNTYTLQFQRKLSNNTALSVISLDNDSLAEYNSQQLHYIIDLPIGQDTLPTIAIYGSSGSEQQIQIDTTIFSMGQQISILVTAEDGITQAQYTLTFQMYPYASDTLLAIYGSDPYLIPGFTPHQFEYIYELPYDTAFPIITWDPADNSQIIVMDTIANTELQFACRIHVTAESGLHNVYTITYNKQFSSVTDLEMIYLSGKPLPNFNKQTKEYVYTLTRDEQIDTISWDLGDEYQTVTYNDSVATPIPGIISTTQIHVTAQNGDTSTYTIYFMLAPNTDSTLDMIYCNGQAVTNFSKGSTSYSIQMNEGETMWPAITYSKHDENQNVEIIYVDSTRTANIVVTADDQQSSTTYTLIFLPYLSHNAYLEAILLNNTLIEDFDADKYIYELTIDSVSQLPQLGYTRAETSQTVTIDTTYNYTKDSLPSDVQYTLIVTAEDNSYMENYIVTIHINEYQPKRPEDNDNAYLQWLGVNGQLISTSIGFTTDFDSETLNYYIYYPIGSNPNLFFADTAVTAIPQDSLAVVKAKDREIIMHDATHIPYKSCIRIIVQAANGITQNYQIHQELILDSLNHVIQLNVADNSDSLREIPNFSKDVYYYEYVLSDTRDNAPAVELLFDNTDSRYASVSFERDNDFRIVDADDATNYENVEGTDDPTYHICYRAENGTKYVYKIKFRRSEIKRAQKPMEGDVLIQHIPGSYQIAVASLRANVTFALYDIHGSMIKLVQLPETDPNSINTITDGFGQTFFGNISDYSSCTLLTLMPSKVYFWVFTENGKRKIKSGKMAIIP